MAEVEVIVVDGMSDDLTRNITKSFCDSNGFQMIDNIKRTTPAGLNIGIRAAKGEVIIRVDGHAVIKSNYITQCMNYLKRTDADCVGGAIHSVQTTSKGKSIALGMSSVFGVGNARFRTSGAEGFVDTGAFLAYRREVFEKIGVFYENLIGCEDDEFHYRLRKRGGKIFFTPRIQSKYYTRATYSDLLRQYFRYGNAKVEVLKLHPSMMKFRQFIPSIFVLGFVLSCLIFSFTNPVFLLIPIAYLGSAILTTFAICSREGWRYFVFLIPVFFCLHFGYGVGFILGFVSQFGGIIRSLAKLIFSRVKFFLNMKTADTE